MIGGVHSNVPGVAPEIAAPMPQCREVGGKSKAARIARVLVHYLGRMVGKRNAMTAPEIAHLCNVRTTGTCQPIRHAAKILLCQEGIPLVSCSKGFYIATTRQELYDYKAHLEARMTGLGRDVEAVKAILRRGNVLENVNLEKVQQDLF